MRITNIASLIILLVLTSLDSNAQQIAKDTYVYAVKGTDSLKLDLYHDGSNTGLSPCIIYIFGGGFINGTRDDLRFTPFFEYMVQRGCRVASIDYRLGFRDFNAQVLSKPSDFTDKLASTVAMAVEDLFDATGYLIENSDDLKIDPTALITLGSSAGAVTALQGEYLIATGGAPEFLPEGFNYAGVISLAGAILDQFPPRAWSIEPCPILMFHGDADQNVPYDRLTFGELGFFGSKSLADRLDDAESPYWFITFTNTDHRIAIDPIDQNREEILSFLNKMALGRQPLQIRTEVSEIGKPEVNKNFGITDFIRKNFGL